MPLRLSAEQKFLEDIFSGKTEYIIPPYQRAYSWGKELCETLFEDIKQAYTTNSDQGYFLGNIVLARSSAHRNSLEVIDGQQRLITLTLLIKALTYFLPKNRDLINFIWISDSEGNPTEIRLKTKVFEDKDTKYLEEVITSSIDEFKIEKNDNNFKINFKFFYDKLKDSFKDTKEFEDFSVFLLSYVSILPIESEDNEHKEARKKALKIFETINNRGLILSNADIFKAELYSMALNESEDEKFIAQWKEVDKKCDDLTFSIDRVFKIYSYEIRGKHGIKSSEIGLREFFDTKNKISPFNKKTYDQIIDDLNNILDAIEYFNNIKRNIRQEPELAKWFQLIDEYTNNFPKDLLFVFLSQRKDLINSDINQIIIFSKSLVRYCYAQGATTTIKYFIYDLTVQIMHGSHVISYPIESRDYTYFGRLYRGFALLLAYLHPEQKAVYPFDIRKLKDIIDRSNYDLTQYDLIGNYVAIDITPDKRESDFLDINEIKQVNTWNYKEYQERQKNLNARLINFFETKI